MKEKQDIAVTIEERLVQTIEEVREMKEELNRLRAFQKETVWRLTDEDFRVALEAFDPREVRDEDVEHLLPVILERASVSFTVPDWNVFIESYIQSLGIIGRK